MATADAVYLPEDVERGAVLTLVASTEVHEGDDGSDDRYDRFPFPKLRAVISYWIDHVTDVETLFCTNRQRYSFLFRPPLARYYTAARQQIGLGSDVDDDTLQLKITKNSGVRTASKNILHPRAATVRVWVDSNELDINVEFSVGALGIITFINTAGFAGLGNDASVIEASFEYDTAMRFISDDIDINIPDSNANSAGTVTYVEEVRRLMIEEVFNE